MLSTDVAFYLCALAIFIPFYWCRSALAQSLILAVGSFAMYATEGWAFFSILCVSLALTSICAYLAASRAPRLRIAAVAAGVVVNLAVLAIFKYRQLWAPEFHTDAAWLKELLALGLPIGISFYTFHGISLVVDAWRDPTVLRHRGNFFAHLTDTALYLSFFPQLVAGPISKGKQFFPQIVPKRLIDIEWEAAASDIIVGMFLKRVVADNLNGLTLPLTDPRTYPGIPQVELATMILGYSAQIFADFAGYSLIAIGVAKLFGYLLPDNFNQPYLAQSITEFWRRWHMSLSAWLRDYLYIPLGGNRRGTARTYLNLLIVMGLGGLWHGAEWKFAVWGLFHGALLVVERLLGVGEPSRGALAVPRVVLTFCLVTFGWLLFRLTSFGDLGRLFTEFMAPWRPIESVTMAKPDVVIMLALTAVVGLFHIPTGAVATLGSSFSAPAFRPYAIGALAVVVLMASGSRHAFIYFQF